MTYADKSDLNSFCLVQCKMLFADIEDNAYKFDVSEPFVTGERTFVHSPLCKLWIYSVLYETFMENKSQESSEAKLILI